ncbi:MAG: hydrolase [Bacteroidales bacterium]|nr:hydrolase [Bacteroidales bacterium]MBN2698939.1 hydrolase [Bacteroidales bacterium]
MRIEKTNSIGLVIDIQERLIPQIAEQELLVKNVQILLEGLQILGIPVLITEQYPKGLGPTLKEIELHLPQNSPIEKIAFSCCDEQAFLGALQRSGKKQVIICGIETHVCILQTVLDLLECSYLPVVIADCVSSRKIHDKEIALARMRQEGAVISSYESILFELTRIAGSDTFKTISKLVK